ncbi:MAG: iron-containing alcohol dehydrogenase [Bacteroidales bacterium]|nr:iron-containing alcohol dehydrogenase [Bacteroidales bacterium]
MENFTFYSPTEFVFGRDTQARTGELVARFGGRRVMIVSGGGSAERSGLLAQVRAALTESGIFFIEQKGIAPNPTDDRVYEGIRMARENNIDFLLAVGGGSVIDSTKAVALGVNYEGDFWDFYCGKATPASVLPLGVVLTIPAAGSEGSGNSVITKLDGKHKISVRYPMCLRPRFAVMNPELTMSLPWFQTACGITDMLCHIYERYFSNTTGTDLTDSIAEAIMRDVMENALILKETPDDYDARAAVMWASTLAHNGLCGCGKVEDWSSHALEHEISAWHNVAHGAGLAVMVPAWMSFVAEKNPRKVVQFAVNVMGIAPEGKTEQEICRLGIEALKGFYHTLGLTTSLRELTGCEPDIDLLVRSLQGNKGETLGSYVPLSMNDCKEIYQRSLIN